MNEDILKKVIHDLQFETDKLKHEIQLLKTEVKGLEDREKIHMIINEGYEKRINNIMNWINDQNKYKLI